MVYFLPNTGDEQLKRVPLVISYHCIYFSLSLIYVVFSVSNWVAPSIVVLIGAKLSMFFGSLLYL